MNGDLQDEKKRPNSMCNVVSESEVSFYKMRADVIMKKGHNVARF